MGQDLSFQCAGRRYETRITPVQWEIAQRIRVHLLREIDTVFEVSELGIDVHLTLDELRTAAGRLDQFLGTSSHLLPKVFEYRRDWRRTFILLWGWSSGGVSGLRVPDDSEHYYAIEAGLDECWFEKWGIGTDGRGRLLDRRDIRGEASIVTTNMGIIQIRGTPVSMSLKGVVHGVVKFCKGCRAADVVKRVD